MGLLGPFLVFFALIEASESKELYAVTPFSIFVVILCGVVAFSASLGMIYKNVNARWFYLLGWVLVGLSPLVLVSSEDMQMLLVRKLIFNLLMGMGIALYLFKNKEVNKYFSS